MNSDGESTSRKGDLTDTPFSLSHLKNKDGENCSTIVEHFEEGGEETITPVKMGNPDNSYRSIVLKKMI